MQSSIINKARGLGIIAVVWGHTTPGFGIDVGLFHMPLFFLLGGLTLNPERELGRVARFVVVDLLFFAAAATFVYSIVAAALEPFGLHFRYFTDWSPIHFTYDLLQHVGHHVGFVLTSWFLIAYAGAVVVSETVVRLLPSRVRLPMVAALIPVLFWIGVRVVAPLYTHATDDWYWNVLSQVMVGSSFFLLGYVLSQMRWFARVVGNSWAFLATIIAFSYLTNIEHPAGMGMVFSQYPLGSIRTALYALLGILGTLQFSALLDRVAELSWLDRVGKASKQVMIHHLFVFTLVNLGLAAAGLIPILAIEGVYWKYAVVWTWPIYVIPAVALPTLGYEAYLRLRGRSKLARPSAPETAMPPATREAGPPGDTRSSQPA